MLRRRNDAIEFLDFAVGYAGLETKSLKRACLVCLPQKVIPVERLDIIVNMLLQNLNTPGEHDQLLHYESVFGDMNVHGTLVALMYGERFHVLALILHMCDKGAVT